MAVYTIAKDNTALSTSADFMTLIPAAAHPIQIIEISIAGMGTASAANSLGVYRSTAGTTGSSGITPTPLGRYSSTNPPVANTVVWTAWATQPTLGGLILDLGVNSNGGIYRWVARPGEEIICAATDEISLRAITGSGSVSIHVVIAEDCF
jgi:hypothetical protein